MKISTNAFGTLLVILTAALPAAAQLTEIHAAARAGRVAQVRALLDKEPALVNARDTAGWTPLHFAAQRGHRELAELLVARRADINARLKYAGGTPLHVAASTCHASIVALLLAKGANANMTDDNGLTPLHRAAIPGCRDVAGLLLAKGASVHAWGNTGETPIDQAVERKHAAFADLLRARGRAALPITDDFSGDCHWPGGEIQGMSFGCDRGAYRLRLKTPGPYHIHQNLGLSASGVIVEVDASVTSGRGTEPGKALLGIACLSDPWHGYIGILQTDGGWAIMRLDKDFTQLAGNGAGSVIGLARTNRLSVACARENGTATLVSFFVNGRRVGSVRDHSGQTPFNGVALYTDTFPGDVVFERFVARAPPD